MIKVRHIWTLLVFLLPTAILAQSSPFSSGTYFVSSLPINGVAPYDSTVVTDTMITTQVHIVGVNRSCFRVSIEDYNFTYEGIVEQDSIEVVSLPVGKGLPLMEQIYNRAVVVSASQPVNVILASNIGLGVSDSVGSNYPPNDFGELRNFTEATCVQPSIGSKEDALMMGGLGDLSYDYGEYASVTSIVSTQDSNLIEFTLPGNTFLNTWYYTQGLASIAKDSTVVLSLDSLEEFSIFNNDNSFIQGSKIKSINNKRFKTIHIGLNGIRSLSNSLSGSFIHGQVYEELRSSKWVDTLFYASPLTGHYGNTYSIVALEGATDVYLNGSFALTLDSLEHIDTTVVGSMVLESSKPVSVYLSSSTHGTLNDNTFSPFSITLQGQGERITRSTFTTLDEPDTTNHYMVGILCPSAGLSSMTLDGMNIASSFLPFAADSLWSWAVLEVEKGVHRLENAVGFTGYQYTYHKMDTLPLFGGSRLYPAYGYTLPQDILWTADSTANLIKTPKSDEHKFGSRVDTVCLGDTVQVSVFGSHFSHLFVDFGDGQMETIQTRNRKSVSSSHIYNQAGTYWVKVSDSIHCRSTDSTQVVVKDRPEAQFEVAVSDVCAPILTLTSTSLGIESVEWQVSGDLSRSSTDGVLQIPLSESVQNLEVILTVFNGLCSSSTSRSLDSLDMNEALIVPNVITPNNDGVNDCFFIANAQMYEPCYQLTIVNRWGSKVFESKDPEECWEPNAIAPGVYFYTLNYGRQSMSGAVTVL